MKYYIKKNKDVLYLIEKLPPLRDTMPTDLSGYETRMGTIDDQAAMISSWATGRTRFGYRTLTDGILIIAADEDKLKEMNVEYEEDFLSAHTMARIIYGTGVASGL